MPRSNHAQQTDFDLRGFGYRSIAQASGAGNAGMGNAPSTSVPSTSQDKTPGVGSATGRSSNSYLPSNPAKPDVDGMHPSGAEINKSPK